MAFKRIALFTPLAIGILMIIYVASKKNTLSPQPELRVGTRYRINLTRIDPAAYGEASEYDYVSYLYSPLLQFNKRGHLIGSVADRFYWSGNDLIFEIRENATTSKGEALTSNDVVHSFKRLNILKPNHARPFFQEVCRGQQLHRLSDPCEGLIAQGNKFIVQFHTKKPLYLDLLTGIDFGIVPLSAYDHDNLMLTDHFNNTGPYKLIEVNEKESQVRLQARRDHWLWKQTIPQKVSIKTVLENGSEPSDQYLADEFYEKRVDLLPTYAAARGVAAYAVQEKIESFDVFKSNPIATYILFFSKKALRDYSSRERLAIAAKLRRCYFEHGRAEFEGLMAASKTTEFFPPTSDGKLDGTSSQAYQTVLDEVLHVRLSRPPVIHVIDRYMTNIIDYITACQGLSYKIGNDYQYPPDNYFQENFDAFFSLINVSSIEGVDSLFWIESMGWLPYSSVENERWLNEYLESEDKNRRVQLLKKMHFDMLAAGVVVPIKVQDYAAISRKPWKLYFSPIFARTPLWEIEYQPDAFK